MALSLTERAYELWDAWSIRVLIFLSLILQVLLILLAPKRKVRGGWIIGLIWALYSLADWVATTTIGFISCNSRSTSSAGPPSDIVAFWAPFLLLHLGGPDNITSYSLEDNELWKRHLLQFLSQVLSTIYVFVKSFSNNELWLASSLVLSAAMIKYLGRVCAFYHASFDNFGKNWKAIPRKPEVDKTEVDKTGVLKTGVVKPEVVIPKQFQGVDLENNTSISGTAVLLFSNLKRILVGPLPKEKEVEEIIGRIRPKRGDEVLRIIEIELSLLYEVLYTKFPVMDSKTGSCSRVANICCILLASISFSLVKKHYQLELVDIFLTYVLLIGALALDILSFKLMTSSDWIAISHIQDGRKDKRGELPAAVIKRRRRWSKSVSQLNFLTDHFKKLDCFPYIGTLLFKVFRSQSSQNLEDQLWNFIWTEALLKLKWREENKIRKEKDARLLEAALEDLPKPDMIQKLRDLIKTSNDNENEAWLSDGEFTDLLAQHMEGNQLEFIKDLNDGLDYTQILLVWHIATELCFQNSDHCRFDKTSEYRSMCKLLSDYMFYLAEKQPTMMTGVLDNWKDKFKTTSKQIRPLVPWKFFSNEKSAAKMILFGCKEVKEEIGAEREEGETKLLPKAVKLARVLQQKDCRYPWKGMFKVWVQWMCFAALRCRPNVHADRLSKGGELLTIVWLLMSHFGFGTKHRKLTEGLNFPAVLFTVGTPVAEDDDSAPHENCPFQPFQPHGTYQRY